MTKFGKLYHRTGSQVNLHLIILLPSVMLILVQIAVKCHISGPNFQKKNLGSGNCPNYFLCLKDDAVLVLDPLICQSVCLQSLDCFDCKSFHCVSIFYMRVVHFFGMLKKEKYLHKIFMFTCLLSQKNFSHAYLVWGPKLDVPKISILLSKPTKNTPCIFTKLWK